MNPLHLLWIVPLTATISVATMTILIVGKEADGIDDDCDIKIVSKDELMKDIPDVNGIVGAGPPDDSGRSGPSGWISEKKGVNENDKCIK